MDDVAARNKGWKTKTLDYTFNHNKEEGRRKGVLKRHFITGTSNGKVPYQCDYFLLKLLPKFFVKPYFLTPFWLFAGYMNARFIKQQRPFPKEVSALLRKEQWHLLKQFFHLKFYKSR